MGACVVRKSPRWTRRTLARPSWQATHSLSVWHSAQSEPRSAANQRCRTRKSRSWSIPSSHAGGSIRPSPQVVRSLPSGRCTWQAPHAKGELAPSPWHRKHERMVGRWPRVAIVASWTSWQATQPIPSRACVACEKVKRGSGNDDACTCPSCSPRWQKEHSPPPAARVASAWHGLHAPSTGTSRSALRSLWVAPS